MKDDWERPDLKESMDNHSNNEIKSETGDMDYREIKRVAKDHALKEEDINKEEMEDG